MKENDEICFEGDGTSDCCGAPVYSDIGICSDCKEHCNIQRTCPECNGTGKVDELDTKKVTTRTTTPPYHKVICDECEGEGFIIEEV